jgi:integrase
VSRPWKKKPWPRVGKKGKKSYVVGYYDHDHRERSKSFSSAGGIGGADEWMRDYRAAERRGPESLRRFLLDLDAREANGTREGRTVGEVAELYFALDAHPDLEGGLAPATFDSYSRYARIYILGGVRQDCCRKPVGRESFAVRLAALMLLRVAGRDPLLALRDATVVSTQYGLAARNQEIWGLRWERLDEEFAEILQVISWGELDEYGKTNKTTERRASMPPLLWADLQRWRAALRAWGHPARDVDFVFPGDLGGKTRGKLDEATGAVHLTKNQCQKWCGKFFVPAVRKVAEREEFRAILGATPYSLRRGGISVRLRAEDAQIVAEECGTSLEMLDRHYAFAMHDLRRYGPAPFNEVWSAAREAPDTTPPPLTPAAEPELPKLRLVA